MTSQPRVVIGLAGSPGHADGRFGAVATSDDAAVAYTQTARQKCRRLGSGLQFPCDLKLQLEEFFVNYWVKVSN